LDFLSTALAAHQGTGAFRELLAGDERVTLTPAELDAAFDLSHHLRHTGAIMRRALGGSS